MPRFKPCWPKGSRDHRSVVLWADRVKQVEHFIAEEERHDALNLTIREAREQYLADCRGRIGLQVGNRVVAPVGLDHAKAGIPV